MWGTSEAFSISTSLPPTRVRCPARTTDALGLGTEPLMQQNRDRLAALSGPIADRFGVVGETGIERRMWDLVEPRGDADFFDGHVLPYACTIADEGGSVPDGIGGGGQRPLAEDGRGLAMAAGGSRTVWALSKESHLKLIFEVGSRLDGGDGRGRYLLVHQKSAFDGWGASLTLKFDLDAENHDPWLAFPPIWGEGGGEPGGAYAGQCGRAARRWGNRRHAGSVSGTGGVRHRLRPSDALRVRGY